MRGSAPAGVARHSRDIKSANSEALFGSGAKSAPNLVTTLQVPPRSLATGYLTMLYQIQRLGRVVRDQKIT